MSESGENPASPVFQNRGASTRHPGGDTQPALSSHFGPSHTDQLPYKCLQHLIKFFQSVQKIHSLKIMKFHLCTETQLDHGFKVHRTRRSRVAEMDFHLHTLSHICTTTSSTRSLPDASTN